jgi:hypothetical protein
MHFAGAGIGEARFHARGDQCSYQRFGTVHDELLRKQGSSFLKKRTKKLLSVTGNTNARWSNQKLAASGKSFLLLFFKKEVLLPTLN